jgi:hypothetical protein
VRPSTHSEQQTSYLILDIDGRWFKTCFAVLINAKITLLLEEIYTSNTREDSPAPKLLLLPHELVARSTSKRFIATTCRNWNPFTRSLPTPTLLENIRLITAVLLSRHGLNIVYGEDKDTLDIYRHLICQEHTKWKIAALADGMIG